MYFIDPHPVVCEACKVESHLVVKELMQLTAFCPACGHSMRAVGEKMRKGSDDWSRFTLTAMILYEIEDKHKIKIQDPSGFDDITVSVLIDLVQSAMPSDHRVLAEREVAWGIKQVANEWNTRVATEGYDIHMPILEALAPERFEKGW